MTTIQYEKVHKLVHLMECLVHNLYERQTLIVHQHVDQFFYMQKAEELKVMIDQLNLLQRTIEGLTARIHSTYAVCASRWCRDARWLNAYILRNAGTNR